MKTLPIIFLALLVGCATFDQNAGKFLASTAQTADTAMQSWAVYVIVHKVSDADQAPVKALYVQYQAQMALAEQAYVAMVKASNTQASQDAFTKAQASLANAQLGLTTKITAITKGLK